MAGEGRWPQRRGGRLGRLSPQLHKHYTTPGPDSHNRTTYWVQVEAVSKQPGYTTNLWMQLIHINSVYLAAQQTWHKTTFNCSQHLQEAVKSYQPPSVPLTTPVPNKGRQELELLSHLTLRIDLTTVC